MSIQSTDMVINMNIAFAKGGADLPIAHALHLPETEIISWVGDFFGGGGFFLGYVFFWGPGIFGFFLG